MSNPIAELLAMTQKYFDQARPPLHTFTNKEEDTDEQG
jgi:hypothetical protein